jgi:hypothetical protein
MSPSAGPRSAVPRVEPARNGSPQLLGDPSGVFRSFDRERGESVSAVRGLAFGMLFSLPVWGLIVWGVSHLVASLG